MSAREYNFDGLVGPTHNYAGLSPGNVASLSHGGETSHPRAAALQGLAKMRFVAGLGVGQAVLPPQPRPSLRVLRQLGFSGSDEQVLTAAAQDRDGHLLRLCSSASSMWTANAATVAPSSDTADGRVHLTPANLQQMFHRAIEADTTHAVLRAIFADPTRFEVHDPLPGGGQLADEGAANHTRLHVDGRAAAHVFAWGRRAWGEAEGPRRFPARQTREASAALARLHRLAPEASLFPQQDPVGIDGGAFHTDVLAVGNGSFLMLHERAFRDHGALLKKLSELLGPGFRHALAREADFGLAEAVRSYAFNSQLLTLPDGSMAVIAPEEAGELKGSRAFLDSVIAGDNPVSAVHYLDVRQSMNNGGGPACLRQRITLTGTERAAVSARVFFDADLDAELVAWVNRFYREDLTGKDLADPSLARESMEALDALTGILRLGSVYDFQQG